MMTQTFRGKTLLDAKRIAYRELGEDAVIVTTRNVKTGGVGGLFAKAEVEVSAMPASRETTPPNAATKSNGPFNAEVYRKEGDKPRGNEEVAGLRAELRGEIRAMKTAISKSSSSEDLAEEVTAMRELLEEMRERALEGNDKSGGVLRAAGFEGTAATILSRLMKRGDQEAPAADRMRDALRELVRTAAWPLASEEKCVIALVGPSGVGKTTTAAKLGAQIRMQGRSVLFVAADTYRVGAVDHLQKYADLLDADLEVASGADELDEILREATADVVIVDTAGRGAPAGDAVEHRLAKDVEGRTRHVLLCMAASTRAVDAERMTRAFSTARPSALVITKLDETSMPAGIAHACAASRLKISTICFGQRVPEDIAQATTNALVDYIVQNGSGTK